jgi:hypothetical protein
MSGHIEKYQIKGRQIKGYQNLGGELPIILVMHGDQHCLIEEE